MATIHTTAKKPPRQRTVLLTHTVLVLTSSTTQQQHRLHQLHTVDGKFFVMGEVAASLLGMQPNALVAQLRSAKHAKAVCAAPDVLAAVVALGLPVEGSAQRQGVMLLPPATVEALLQDARRLDLLQAFRMSALKLASQVGRWAACVCMAGGPGPWPSHTARSPPLLPARLPACRRPRA